MSIVDSHEMERFLPLELETSRCRICESTMLGRCDLMLDLHV